MQRSTAKLIAFGFLYGAGAPYAEQPAVVKEALAVLGVHGDIPGRAPTGLTNPTKYDRVHRTLRKEQYMSQEVFYNIVSAEDGGANVTVVIPTTGEFKVASSTHPNFKAIIGTLTDPDTPADESIAELFDVATAISNRLQRLSERVTVKGNTVLFDGDPVAESIQKQILRFVDAGVEVDGYGGLVKFLDKLYSNPNARSREQLYEWLDRHDFTITNEGDIVGYKGVQPDPTHGYVSISAGPAVVDGKEVNGQVPNYIGAVVEIARSKVVDDSARGCASGLHFGTYEYASGFARGALLEVHVNPRDVVSVPTDCNAQKVRTARYKVVDIIDAKILSPLRGFDPEGDFSDSDWADDIEWDTPAQREPVDSSSHEYRW